MKRFLILLVITCFTNFVHAQAVSNENTQLPELSDPLSILNQSTGWCKINSGQWVSQGELPGFSALPDVTSAAINGKVTINLPKAKNYQKMEVRTISLEGKEYMVLLIYQLGGAYKFADLKKDWYQYRYCDYYVFRKENVVNLKSNFSQLYQAYSVPFHTVYSGTVFSSKLNEIATDIQLAANKGFNSKDIVFDILLIEEQKKKKVRFLFRNAVFINGISYSKFDPLIFDKQYFEIESDTFNNFLKFI